MAQSFGNTHIQGFSESSRLHASIIPQKQELVLDRNNAPQKRIQITLPNPYLSILNDQCFVFSVKDTQGPASVYRWQPSEGWSFLGRVPTNLRVSRLFAMGENTFLVAGAPFLIKAEKASPYGIGKINENGELELTQLIDLQVLGAPPIEKFATAASKALADSEEQFLINKDLKKLLFQQRAAFNVFIPNEKGGTLLFHWPGYLITLDQKGNIVRFTKIYSSIDFNKVKNLFRIEPVLLGAALKADGKLLLATRTEEAVLKAHAAYPSFNEDGTPVSPVELAASNTQMRIEQFPEIVWREFDPLTGKLEKVESTPPGAPWELKDFQMAQKFDFTVDRNGHVEFIR